VPLYGEGLNVRDWLHVDDHCRGIQLVAEQGAKGESYNIGGGREMSNKELTGHLLEALGADWDMVERVEDRKGHDLRYSVDHSKLAAMGYAPQHSFEDGSPRRSPGTARTRPGGVRSRTGDEPDRRGRAARSPSSSRGWAASSRATSSTSRGRSGRRSSARG
jgi:hypothetical protein